MRIRMMVALLGLIALLATGLAFSVPASAAGSSCYSDQSSQYTKCSFYGPAQTSVATFTVAQTGVQVYADLKYVVTNGSGPHSFYWVLYLQQCRGDGTACGTLAALSGGASSADFDKATPFRNYSFGHVYRACGSVKDYYYNPEWDLLNVCSPFLVN